MNYLIHVLIKELYQYVRIYALDSKIGHSSKTLQRLVRINGHQSLRKNQTNLLHANFSGSKEMKRKGARLALKLNLSLDILSTVEWRSFKADMCNNPKLQY